jgi:2-hydroxyacyl-CoA lyase 1
LHQRPGICLCVSGPGFVNALSGVSNALINCWPLILICGSSETYLEGLGAFQEFKQVEMCAQITKYSARPSSMCRIPFYVEMAFKKSTFGRPGPVYLDFPGDFITGEIEENYISSSNFVGSPPRSLASWTAIDKAINLLSQASSPLIIIGKGASYDQTSTSYINSLVEISGFPFIATPMAKGIVPDVHSHCVGAARTFALKNADCILLLGARLNWILHFGLPPRFKEGVHLIQADVCAEELPHTGVSLHGDLTSICKQFLGRFEKSNAKKGFRNINEWWQKLNSKKYSNLKAVEILCNSKELPMNYYQAFHEIKPLLPTNFFLVSEGANTMDISRTMIDHYYPRTRLDAGSFGTMGVG